MRSYLVIGNVTLGSEPLAEHIRQCLARGDKCGAHAARAYCQQRDFAQAISYRRVDLDEITGSVPKNVTGRCGPAGCNEYVAITCER